MKDIVVKALVITGVAVGIAALGVGVQRLFSPSRDFENNPTSEDDELDIAFRTCVQEEPCCVPDETDADDQDTED